MKSQPKRLSILSLPEARELYSVPTFPLHEREYFFTLTDDELVFVNRLNLHRNRIHLILMLGYFKLKPVCLTYRWGDIVEDYNYVAERYFPSATRKKKNLNRQTRSRLYNLVFAMVGYQRCDQSVCLDLLNQLERRAKSYIDETQLFHDAIAFLKLKEVAIPRYSTLQNIISNAINTEETRLSQLMGKHLPNHESFTRLLDSDEKQGKFNDLKKMAKAYKSGENKREISRHQTLTELSKDAFRVIENLKLTEGNIRYFATRCQKYNIRDLRELHMKKR